MSAPKTAGGGASVAGEAPASAPVSALTYSVPQACALLGISRQRAHRLLTTEGRLHPDIPCIKIGARWVVVRKPVDRLLGIEA